MNVVQVIRFTDSIAPMRAFLELVGLRVHAESENGQWVDFAGGAGRVALHSVAGATSGAVQGQTSLSFESDDVAGLATRLEAAGVPDVAVYDEAYNKSLSCTDPHGETIIVNGVNDDLYGYRPGDQTPDERLRVTAVMFTEPTGPYGAFLGHLDFTPVGELNEYYVNFAGPERAGQVGLHHVYTDDLPVIGGRSSVQLNFETAEPLDDIVERLRDAGHDAEIMHAEFGSLIRVADTDGLETQIHQTRHL